MVEGGSTSSGANMNADKRTRSRLLIALVSLLAAGLTAIYVLVGMRQDAQVFLGKADAASGYRYRFTLSSTWEHKVVRDEKGVPIMEQDNREDFIRAAPAGIFPWICSHLLHLSTPYPAKISVITAPKQDWSRAFRIKGGYPESSWALSSELVISERHFSIDGCPATVVRVLGVHSPKHPYYTYLYVYVPNRSLLYCVTGRPGTSDQASTDQAMQALIASFHVEKVAVPSRSKR